MSNNNSLSLYCPLRIPEFQLEVDVITFDDKYFLHVKWFPAAYCVQSVVLKLQRLRSCHDECLVTKAGQHILEHPRPCQPTLSPFPCSSSHQQLQPMPARLHFRCTTAVVLFIINKYMKLYIIIIYTYYRLPSLWSLWSVHISFFSFLPAVWFATFIHKKNAVRPHWLYLRKI